MADLGALLREARSALADDEPERALVALIEAWQHVAAAEIAEAVELVGKRAARHHHPPTGTTDEDRDAAWFDAADIGDPVMRQRLIENVTDVSARFADPAMIMARAQAIAVHRDPRVATMLLALAATKLVSVNHFVPEYWRPLFKLIEACGDPRVREVMEDMDWSQRLKRQTETERAVFDARITKVDERLAAAYPDPPPALVAAHAAIVAEILAAAAAPLPNAAREAATEAGLLAAIYASPAEDGPRAVYADWLQERGDPRGEFIALGIANRDLSRYDAGKSREMALLHQYETRWLGPLAPCVKSTAYDRGFLDACKIERLVDDPAWATLRTVSGAIPTTDAHPTPILATATGLDADALIRLEALQTLPPLETIGWSGTDEWEPDNGFTSNTRLAIAAFARTLPRLTHLRRLLLDGPQSWIRNNMRPDQLEWTWRDTQIRSLRVAANLAQTAVWFAAVQTSRLDDFTLVGAPYAHPWRIRIARTTPGGPFDKVVIDRTSDRYAFDEDFAHVAIGLATLPAIASIKMDVPAKSQWTPPNRYKLAEILERFPAATVDVHGYTKPIRPMRRK